MKSPIYPQAPAGYTRNPSTTRPGRFFYHHAARRVSVLRSWSTDNWLIRVDGRGIQSGEFATAQEAFDAIDRRDIRA